MGLRQLQRSESVSEVPNANLNQIVRAWHEYKTSENYEKRCEESQPKTHRAADTRARPDSGSARDADTHVWPDEDAVEMARRLRAEYKDVIRYVKYGTGWRPTAETVAKYQVGRLREEANAATRTIRSRGRPT